MTGFPMTLLHRRFDFDNGVLSKDASLKHNDDFDENIILGEFEIMSVLTTRVSLAGQLYLNKRCGGIGSILRWLHFKCTAAKHVATKSIP